MSYLLDIQKLAADALASVEAEEQTKLASDQTSTPSLSTEIGRQLKSAAELVRNTDLASVTNSDIHSLLKQAGMVGGTLGGIAGSVGGPVGAVMGAGTGHMLENAITGPGKTSAGNAQAATQAPMGAGVTPKLGSSELGNELRKLAHTLRDSGQRAEEARLIKAAHMYNAGVGLAHLLGEVR